MTIKDIARESGYAVGTVSRVLNHRPDVSDEAREKILAVVRERNFQLNSNAKHLKQQGGTGVAVVVKGIQNMLFARIVEEAQASIQKSGLAAAVYYLDEDADEVCEALRVCMERKPLGILFLGGDLDFFRARFGEIEAPCVLLTNTAAGLGFDNLSSLTTDDREAAACAVDFLVGQGHRRIGVLGGNLNCSQISYRRLQGCEASFAHHNIPFDRQTQYQGARFSMTEAYDAVGRLLDKAPDLTAVFAMSDVMALGAIRALADRGKRVPEDISVMGYDGIELGEYAVPRLATVRQDVLRLARRGVEILLNQIKEKAPAVHELAPFRVSAGESVRAL